MEQMRARLAAARPILTVATGKKEEEEGLDDEEQEEEEGPGEENFSSSSGGLGMSGTMAAKQRAATGLLRMRILGALNRRHRVGLG